MRAFAGGDVDVLVSTTVIEVGRRRRQRHHDGGPRRRPVRRLAAPPAARPGRARRPPRALPAGHVRATRLAGAGAAGGRRLDRPTASSSPSSTSSCAARATCSGGSSPGSRSSLRLLSVVRDVDVIEEARAAATAVVERDPELGRARRAPGRGRGARRSGPRPTSWTRHDPHHRRPRRRPAAADPDRATSPGRPSDRVREALFSAVRVRRSARSRGCGSSTCTPARVRSAWRRWSRGAAAVTLVEQDRRTAGLIRPTPGPSASPASRS